MSSRARILFLAIIAVTAAACIRLGLWQLERLGERRAENRVAEAARALPEVVLTSRADSIVHRRVRVTGTWDRAHELILRGQAHREEPGVLVVTPLRIRGGSTAVLVLRGFVPSPDAITLDGPPPAESGEVTVHGIAFPLEEREDEGGLLERPGKGVTWKGLDRSAIEARVPYPLADAYLMQLPDSSLAAMLRQVQPPALDDGPHLSYAIQWFAFAAIALVGAVALLGRKGSAARGVAP